MKNQIIINKIIGSLFATSSILIAASDVPNIDNAIKNITPPKEVLESKKPLIQIDGIKKYVPAMVDDKSGRKIFVKDFKITGITKVSELELKMLLSDFVNKDLSFKELTEASSIITKYYRNKGYFISRAYLPVQDFKQNNNVFEIAVIEGSYDKFNLENSSRVKTALLQNVFDNTKNNDPIVSTNSLDRTMLIVNNTPGAQLKAIEVKPGDEVGSSSFDVKVDKSSLINGYLVGDNYGSKYTGENRLMAGASINSPFEIGDQLSFGELVSNNNGLNHERIAYSFPLSYNGLRGEFSYSNTTYELTGIEGVYDGTSKNLDFTLSYPILKSRNENLDFLSTISSKKLKDYQEEDLVTNKEIKSLNLLLKYSLQSTILGLDSRLNSSATYTAGVLTFNDQDSKDIDDEGAKTSGRYDKIEATTSLDLQLSKDFIFSNSIFMQHSLGNKNLDGTEDFSVGGIDRVRFYSSSEESAENGIVFSSELLRKLPIVNNISQKVSLFYDLGTVDMQDSTYDEEFERRNLQDIGLGYYLNYKDFFAKAYSAWNINNEVTSEENYNNKILFQAGLSF